MKKFCIPVLLFVLLTPEHINARNSSFKISVAALSNRHELTAYFNIDYNYTLAEIENSSVGNCTIVKTNQGFQKLSGYITCDAKRQLISPGFSSLQDTIAVELFDNSYLSHNYPSHNFW